MTTMDTKPRFPAFGMVPSQSGKGQMRPSSKPVGSVWNNRNGSAWGSNGAIGSGARSVGQDSGRAANELSDSSPLKEPLTGSRSLLPSSESDTRTVRQNMWQTAVEDMPPVLNINSTSPLLRQKSNHSAANNFGDNENTNPPFLSVTAASGAASSQSSQNNYLDPSAGTFISGLGDSVNSQHSSRHNSEDNDPYAARRMYANREPMLNLRNDRASMANSMSGYNSSAASRSGSQPPSRNDVEYSLRQRRDPRAIPHHRIGNTTPGLPRGNLTANAMPFVTQNGRGGQSTEQLSHAQLENIEHYFERIQISRDDLSSTMTPPLENQSHPNSHFVQDRAIMDEPWRMDETNLSRQAQFSPTGSGSGSLGSGSNQYRAPSFHPQHSQSPNSSDARLSHQSPYYSSSATPPYQQQIHARGLQPALPNSQAALLERKLQGLQEQQQQQMQQRRGYGIQHSNPLQYANQASHPYDMQTQNVLRLNPLNAAYYNMTFGGSHVPRGPASHLDVGQQIRSALLEEFRNNGKTNKRYELKDIYNHMVEFSGDQHGSRFIQQKLETANSDEKDQVFRELHPNARQLMTDVFGNYVIQKFFEHGNQAQKKLLANQMRNHVLALSMQIYGCRVVQKALEHILTDQQAQLVAELRHDVMKCVKDQNGNHVVQKAIERVPAEHIQFIIGAFAGRVQESATHPYGCRVIQRMLEYCEEPTRIAVLQELHSCSTSLIVDQYGNYVTQHVIEHGKTEDRRRIIQLVTHQLVNYSKHKFASNVVEKSIQFGSVEERQAIVRILSVLNDEGESPVQGLIRDQYGNYVMQKLITQLRGPEWADFIDLTKIQISLLKRKSYSNGKQIAAVEKVLYTDAFTQASMAQGALFPPSLDTSAAPTPPLATSDTQSPQSSSVPSTHANSVDVPNDSRKSSGGSNYQKYA